MLTRSTTNRWRVLATFLALAALATACMRTPPGGEVAFEGAGDGFGAGDAGTEHGAFEGDAGVEESGEAVPSAPEGLAGQESASSGSGGAPGGAPGSEGSGGDAGAPGSPASPGGGAGGGQAAGVTGGTVKFVYSTQLEDCGSDPTTSNQGTANEKGLMILSEWVKWFNEAVLAEEGWQLEYEVVDDGGSFCPEKAQAAAQKIVKEIKPFAVLSNLTQPARGPIVADTVTRAGIVHIGSSWSTADKIRERAPYAWPVSPVAERLFQNLAAWMEQRVKGTQVDGSVGLSGERVYGLLALDSPEGRELAGVMRRFLGEAGIEVSQVYLMSGDPGIAAQQASNTALKMRQDGINSLVFAVPYPAAINSTIVLSEAMNAQNYLPDIFVGNYGLSLFDSLHNRRVWANAQGTSIMPALVLRWAVAPDASGTLAVQEEFDEIPENESGYIKVWQDQLGHNDQPQDESVPPAYDTWSQLSMLVAGLMHADGPLSPESFGNAVHSTRRGGPNRCTIGRFLLRDYIYSSGFDWELGNSGLRSKSTSVYWVNRQTPMGSNGYYESYDNYRFYGAEEWPAEHTRDTGQQGVDIPKQERIGIRPWTPCSQFPNYPSS